MKKLTNKRLLFHEICIEQQKYTIQFVNIKNYIRFLIF